jgi:hypothetical protein
MVGAGEPPLAQDIRARGGKAHAFGVDAWSEEETPERFRVIKSDIGLLEVMVFNIGANVTFPGVDTTARVFQKTWRWLGHPLEAKSRCASLYTSVPMAHESKPEAPVGPAAFRNGARAREPYV